MVVGAWWMEGGQDERWEGSSLVSTEGQEMGWEEGLGCWQEGIFVRGW